MVLDDKVILITGGTGSFGKKFTELAFKLSKPRKIIIFSRDEYKQHDMSTAYPSSAHPIRFFLGDVRDRKRLCRALTGVDYVIHAAAIKQVPSAEYNPFEAVKTNILGAQNLIEAALEANVDKVIALSTDKAVSPINLYGATKLAMEKIMVAANAYVGTGRTTFSVVRYGNVLGSRGSVIPYFQQILENGETEMPITDKRMSRFWITLGESFELVCLALQEAVGGEVFVPKIPSMRITDLARAMCPECTFRIVGIRPGEKLHESLISEDDGRSTAVMNVGGREIYVILPPYHFESKRREKYETFPKVPEDFVYRSDLNEWWLSVDELKKLL